MACFASRSGDVLKIGELFMLHQLHEQGLSISEIARRSGLDLTVLVHDTEMDRTE
jgi:hypothetical protein